MKRLWAIVCATAACATATTGTAPPAAPRMDPLAAPVVLERWTMGTRLRVIAWASEREVSAALDECDRLDALLSTYRPESPLSELNRRAGEAVHVPAEVHRFVRGVVELSERTGGAFDPTVGPLLAALRREDGVDREAAVHTAQALVGVRHVEVLDGDVVALRLAGMSLDPGAVGKGWAVDAMVATLRRAGVTRAFIDFGESSFYGLGAPPGEAGWKVRLRDADGEPTGPVVVLRDRSLSSSMSLAIPEEPGQVARAHIVDPRSGRFIDTPRLAAVVSVSAAEADALSTALVVLGEGGLDILEGFRGATAWLQDGERPPVVQADFPAERR